jgi:Uncharacterized protein conserved in bacteria (DUF2155)
MSEDGQRPANRRWVFLGLAIAFPLAAVALYFAFFAPPQTPAPVPGGPSGSALAGLPPDHPPVGGAGGAAQGGDRPHPQIGGTSRAVRVPDTVKGRWRAVKLVVETKGGGSPPQTITLNLGGEVVVPGSKLKLRAEEFLPALQVKGNEITSGSNEPANPAALMTIWEDGKQVFHGWLFSKFPDMQPFEHPTYRITLIEGVPKG